MFFYSEFFQKYITVEHRKLLIECMFDIYKKFKLFPETLFCAISLLDRFSFLKTNIRVNMYYLVGLICLSLSYKFIQGDDYDISMKKWLKCVENKPYTKKDFLWMEIFIFKKLDYFLTNPSIYELLYESIHKEKNDTEIFTDLNILHILNFISEYKNLENNTQYQIVEKILKIL